MLDNNFIDAHSYLNTDDINFTWSPNNVKNSVHQNMEIDKIDHLFYHNHNDKNINILESKIILYEKNIKINNNEYCCLSDHNGLLTTIEIK
jgi:hypothetical protein